MLKLGTYKPWTDGEACKQFSISFLSAHMVVLPWSMDCALGKSNSGGN